MDDTLKLFGIDTHGVKYDEMTHEEKATLDGWLSVLQKDQLTVNGVLEYVRSMRDSVEEEIAETPETERVWLFFVRPNRKAVLLKARLKCYMLLEAFLYGPEKAKKALEKRLNNI